MHRDLLDILQCPACGKGSFSLTATSEADREVAEGTLACDSCAKEFAITGGIPRFVPPEDNYCGNFGFQWNKWKAVQVDRLAGHTLSGDRLHGDTTWSPEWLKGKLVLDAGCGAGRFTDVLASDGARVISMDLSEAVDACHETTRAHGERVQCLQASLFELPFKDGVFDAVMCMGVIQHTPDPARVMRGLPRLLKPAAPLVYNFYERGQLEWIQFIKYGLRSFTPSLPVDVTLGLSKLMTVLFFPFTFVLSRIPVVRQVIRFIPICATHHKVLTVSQQFTWTLLDTFDWYGPRYELRQDHRQVVRMLDEMGLDAIEGQEGIVRARAPAASKDMAVAAD